MKEKTIYDLKLHEIMQVGDMSIMRVAGGWLYDCWDISANKFKRGTFVPFNNEFQKLEHEFWPKTT